MSAYVIVEVNITDPATYEEYKRLVPPSIDKYGGRFIVRGGAAELLEGETAPARIVVLEFEDVARAKAWWASEEYAHPKALRQSASTARLIVVEGV